MRRVLRLVACGGAVVGLLFTVACLACNESGGPGTRWLGGANPFRRLLEEQRLTDELEGRRADGLGRLAFLKETMNELIADRITLREAATRSRALARETPGFDGELLRLTYPGRTDDERHCRRVIAWVKVELQDQPGKAAALAARLEAELEGHLEQDAAIRLPRSNLGRK